MTQDPEKRTAAPSTGELVSQLSDELSRLVRDEFRLAGAEVSGKAKKAGVGIGMFGASGVIALYGVGVLLAAAVLGLATVLDAWLAAVIVGVALLLIAGLVAVIGKREVEQGVPPVPSRAVAGVREDVDAVRHPSEHH